MHPNHGPIHMTVFLIGRFINRETEGRENKHLTLLQVAHMRNLFFFADPYCLVPKGRMWLGLPSVMWAWVTPPSKPTR